MILVAITGIEIVIIYIQSFEGSIIIGVLFATSILKFVRSGLVVYAFEVGQSSQHHFVSNGPGNCTWNFLRRNLYG